MNFGRPRRLSTYDDALLPTNDTFFAFDGTNSDLARQLFLRAKAGGSASKFTNLVVPETVNKRLHALKLSWDELSGIAQRALLWDSGFGVTLENKVVKIWTLAGYSMAELAVPLSQFKAVGCTERNCTQADETVSYSNLYCTGEQMIKAARCAIEDFDQGDEMHLAMWMTGGNPQVIPFPRVIKHAWKEKSTNVSYQVLAVHTVNDITDEAAYDACPSKEQNDEYGSLVFSCYTKENVPEGVRDAMVEVQGSPWVSRWLKKDFSTSKSTTSTSTDRHKVVLIAPIAAGILVVVGVIIIFVFIKRKRQRNIEADALEDSLIFMEGENAADKIPVIDYTPDRSSAQTIDTVFVSDRGVDKTIKFLSSASSFGSGSNHTLQILLKSEFLIGKRIPYDNLTFQKSLSKGACGEVWLGEYQGQQIAMKRLLQIKTHRADEVEEFAREIELTASFVHPNVASFIGVAWNSLNNLVMILNISLLETCKRIWRRTQI